VDNKPRIHLIAHNPVGGIWVEEEYEVDGGEGGGGGD